MRCRAERRKWWLHLGQTFKLFSISLEIITAEQLWHFVQRPSGTLTFLPFDCASGVLSFLNQAIVCASLEGADAPAVSVKMKGLVTEKGMDVNCFAGGTDV